MRLRLARNRLAQETFLASLERHRKDGNTFGKPRAELAEGRDEGSAIAGRASFLRADSRSADSIRPPTSVRDVWCPDSSLDREVEEHTRMAHPIFHPDSAITRPLPPCWYILHGSETWRADADPHLHAHFGLLYHTHPGLARHAAGARTSASSRDSGAAAYSALGAIAHIEGWQKSDLFTRGGSKDGGWRCGVAMEAKTCAARGGMRTLVLSCLGAGRVWHTSGAHDMCTLLARSSYTRLSHLPSLASR
ncbi:hypothetical protein B0H14DRAFT_3872258 [Mycena olivaceomarginata]|nr:hypothetical protein B0H14DRAFT_3872258 [Mycena olivaceomarginata]